MPYVIYRHPDIERDLLDIADLLIEYAGKTVALNKISAIEQAIKKLADTPHIGTICDYIYPGLRAIPSARKGVITFTVDDASQSVFIVSITYAGADWLYRVRSRNKDTGEAVYKK